MKDQRNPLEIGELLTSVPGIKEYTTLFKGLCNEKFFIGFTEKKIIFPLPLYTFCFIFAPQNLV